MSLGDLFFFNFFDNHFTRSNSFHFLTLLSFLVSKIFNFIYLFNFFIFYVFFFFCNLFSTSYINFFFDILKINYSTVKLDSFFSIFTSTISFFKNLDFSETYFSRNFQYSENRKFFFLEKGSSQRFSRYYTTTPSYDYKTGHYLGL